MSKNRRDKECTVSWFLFGCTPSRPGKGLAETITFGLFQLVSGCTGWQGSPCAGGHLRLPDVPPFHLFSDRRAALLHHLIS
jgi:hypothetical protein